MAFAHSRTGSNISMRLDLYLRRTAAASAARRLALGWLCAALLGCGAPPPRKEPAQLQLRIETSDNLNGDDRGRAAPVMVRVYELGSAKAFDNADFFNLHNDDRKTLGADLLAVDEFILRPGAGQRIERRSNPATTAVGVLVGYRELGKSVWRATWKLPEAHDAAWYRAMVPDRRVQLRVHVGDQAVSITEVN